MTRADHLPTPAGPWTAEQAASFVDSARIPVRLATTGGSGPTVQSMWFVRDGGMLWCATRDDAFVVTRLQRDPRCGFEVAADTPPYRGVRGTATAQVLAAEGEQVLRRLLDRYLGGTSSSLARWLLSRADREVALCLTPLTLVSWDYTTRMSGG
jgi:nitroimidazol reductase NimA-like FMN-containing flavoprotein (pyridoxamine 5'-phosphate oxidase superfamily)